jgi:Carboxypeptidase regulatory-like domain
MRGLVWIVVCAACAWAQTASVEGVATSSITGSPLAHVHVVLKNPADNAGAQYGAETADDGRFSMTGVPATRDYVLSGARAGYALGRISLTLQRDEKRIVQLKLVPTGAITGRITGSAGEPIERARVIAEGPDRKESTTDEDGHFRIGGLTPGKYRVRATSDCGVCRSFLTKPEILADGSLQLRDAATWYPGVLESWQSRRVEVKPDSETAGIDIQLVGVPFVRVSGKVVGMPPQTAQAYATLGSHTIGGGVGNPIKPDGSFQFWGVDPGKYRLSAGWGGLSASYVSTEPIQIEVGGSNVDNIELHVLPASDLAGRLLMESAEVPQSNAQARVSLRQIGYFASNAGDSTLVTPDDTFRLINVRAGKYAVSVSRDGVYVKSMRLGVTEFEGDILNLSNASGAADLTVVLSNAVGSISGTAHDAKGNPVEALVILARDRGEETLIISRSTNAQANGSYSFPNIAPGSYKVIALPRDDADILRDPFGLAAYDDLIESVEVAPGSKVSMDIERRD